MKNVNMISLTLLCTLLIATGCQPKLAESPYGAREKQWEDFIKETYPDWQPPQTEPPARMAPVAPADENAPQIVEDDSVIVEVDDPLMDTSADNDSAVAPPATTAEFQTYTVQKGDTLWSISRKFYGSGKSWRKIFQANQDVLSTPDKVRAGTELKIPAQQ